MRGCVYRLSSYKSVTIFAFLNLSSLNLSSIALFLFQYSLCSFIYKHICSLLIIEIMSADSQSYIKFLSDLHYSAQSPSEFSTVASIYIQLSETYPVSSSNSRFATAIPFDSSGSNPPAGISINSLLWAYLYSFFRITFLLSANLSQ